MSGNILTKSCKLGNAMLVISELDIIYLIYYLYCFRYHIMHKIYTNYFYKPSWNGNLRNVLLVII